MAINTEAVQKQSADLAATCWSISNSLRGGMDPNEFKNYILGVIFYRYLSERTECLGIKLSASRFCNQNNRRK